MPNFDSGVKSYVCATCEITVNFPVDDRDREGIACIYCPYLSSNEKYCHLNKEIVAYPRTYVGDKCPLTRKE